MFLGYGVTPFQTALPHIPAVRDFLPISAVYLLLVKSELVRQFHKGS
jgi:hypothetical protein